MKILVTGGSGFLGSHLCRALKTQGHDVTAPLSSTVDLRKAGSLEQLNHIIFDQIYHLAAWTQAGDFCLYHSGEQWVINQQMNTNLLAWWQQHQPQAKLIAIGSSCCYEPGTPHAEENFLRGMPIESLFTYAMTKRMLYTGLLALNKQFGLRFLFVIPSTLYGPDYHLDGRQMHFIFDLMRKMVDGKYHGQAVTLWGDGSQRRELIHVRDFVHATLKLAEKVDNDIVNIGGGAEFSIRHFAESLCKFLDYDPSKIQYDTTKYVGAKSKTLQIEKLKRLLPDFQHTPLESGLLETLSWYLKSLGLAAGAEGAPGVKLDAHQLVDQAITAIKDGKIEETLSLLDRARRIDPGTRDLNYLHAIILVHLKDFVAARAALDLELHAHPGNPAAKSLQEDLGRDLSAMPAPAPAATAVPQSENEARLIERFQSPSFAAPAVNQFVTTFLFGDGVGNCIRLVKKILDGWGIRSTIFAEGADERLRGEWTWFQQPAAHSSAQDFAFFHPSDGRSPIIPYLHQLPGKKFLYYHNITPSRFFAPYDQNTALICETAVQAVHALRPMFSGAVCDSEFNARDLVAMGYPAATVLPIPFFSTDFDAGLADAVTAKKYSDGLTNILFVGRFAPNKCQHEVVRAFDYYQKKINPNSRLILAGDPGGTSAYSAYVRQTIEELGAQNIVITGHISFSELIAFYQTARVLLCLSEHEGFCIPLLEAMHFNVPIAAFDSSAVSETLAGSKELLNSKEPESVAHAIDRLAKESTARTEAIEFQRNRIGKFSEKQFRERLAGFLLNQLAELPR